MYAASPKSSASSRNEQPQPNALAATPLVRDLPRPRHDEAREWRGIVCFVRHDPDGCLTAEVSQLADGRWAARLLTRPCPLRRSHAGLRARRPRLASDHSDSLSAETFFAERPAPRAARKRPGAIAPSAAAGATGRASAPAERGLALSRRSR
jgi:hypothetical protein